MGKYGYIFGLDRFNVSTTFFYIQSEYQTLLTGSGTYFRHVNNFAVQKYGTIKVRKNI